MARRFRSGTDNDSEKAPAKTPASRTPTPPVKPDADEPTPASGGSVLKGGLDFIVMLAGAVVVALAIKAYVFDVYLIPSGSMETALHGRPDGGDRIFCTKLNYRFRAPKRWEVAVFEFPYESAKRSDIYNISDQYKGQNFVKRITGLPGESLAISRGDIWVRPGSASTYERATKSDSVQRGMWLKVYEENFKDISLEEFELFWKMVGGHAEIDKGGPLVLKARSEAVRMDYRPLVVAGERRDLMTELPGVPDRYVLEQPVQFRCRNTLEDGGVCGHVFTKTIQTQNITGRCPRCGSMADERSVIFYHRRSGLPALGRYAVNPRYASQGEEAAPRQPDYHIVPDLRIVADVNLENESTALALTLREDARFLQAVIHGNGLVEILENGEPARPEWRATSNLRPGSTYTVEFYVADGVARLFVNSATPVLEGTIWNDKRALPRNTPRSSGASISATGGDTRIAKLAIDRDVFYYSGWEQDRGERFGQMNSSGEIFIPDDSFFPMGDHATSSFDARSWGPVPTSLLRGPALLVWWPPERIRLIPKP